MIWVRRVAAALLLLALCLDLLLSSTTTVWVLLGTVAGLAAFGWTLRLLSTRRIELRTTVAVLVLVALACVVVGGFGGWSPTAAWGASTLAGAAAAARRTSTDTGVVVAAGMISVLSPFGLRGDPTLVALFGVAVALGLSVVVSAGLLLQAHELRMVETRRMASAEERSRIAADLHDLVAHEVTGIAVLAQAVAPTATDPAARRSLDTIAAAAARAMGHIRSLVSPESSSTPRGSLRRLVEAFAAASPAEVFVALPDHDLTAEVSALCERVLSECLTNVHRHAGAATLVEARVREGGGAVEIAVRNDGVGPGSGGLGSGGGSGLDRLRRTLESSGGSLATGPDGQAHWLTRARLPVDPEVAS